MISGAYRGEAQSVMWATDYDGVQAVTFEPGRTLLVPPVEYTVKPGDRFVVETAPDRLDEGCEIWRIQINEKPAIYTGPLWDAYFQNHPRRWLGEYVEDGRIMTIGGYVRQ